MEMRMVSDFVADLMKKKEDVVVRLRGRPETAMELSEEIALMDEAADEIERLRTALKSLLLENVFHHRSDL
jgi:hypothetical protein